MVCMVCMVCMIIYHTDVPCVKEIRKKATFSSIRTYSVIYWHRTLTSIEAEINSQSTAIFQGERPVNEKEATEKLVSRTPFEVLEHPPKAFVNLLVLDPPTVFPKTTMSICSKRTKRRLSKVGTKDHLSLALHSEAGRYDFRLFRRRDEFTWTILRQ